MKKCISRYETKGLLMRLVATLQNTVEAVCKGVQMRRLHSVAETLAQYGLCIE
jgi:hypothetical protein